MLVSIWMERLFTLVVVHLNKNIFRKHETHLITLRRSEHGSKTGKMVKISFLRSLLIIQKYVCRSFQRSSPRHHLLSVPEPEAGGH